MCYRIVSLLAAALVSLETAGCASSQSHLYTLNSASVATTASPVQTAVLVASVSVPTSVDQPAMVVQVDQNRVENEEFNRWAAPLDESIARAVAGDLSALLATPTVTSAPLANFNPAYVVTINVQRFESVKGKAALIDAVWAVRRTANGRTWSGRSIANEPVQGEGFDALAAAHSQAIARLSEDIATAIRNSANGNT